jgi:hypothetical protein
MGAGQQDMLATRAQQDTPVVEDDSGEIDRLIAALRTRLDREAARRVAAEAREAAAREALAAERQARQRSDLHAAALSDELAAIEASLAAPEQLAPATARFGTILYVGGRSGQTAQLRRAAAELGAELLHFDAEQGATLLPGLVGRADLVVFPVDCVSHDAALGVKRLCRQLDRPYRPLRSTGVASLLAALREPVALPG